MSNNLSQIVADLLAQSVEGKDPSAQVQQLGLEVRKVIQRDDTLYGKFRGLLDSFQQIIPDENQRYLAALQALSTTSKLGRQEIIKAINSQLEELKIVEQGLAPFLASWRDTLKAMEARQQAIKIELAQLREKVAQLENEDRTLLAMKAAREQNLGQAEKTIRELFANIGLEISGVSRKMAELPAEGAAAQTTQPAAQPAPPPVQPAAPAAPASGAVPVGKSAGGDRNADIQAPPPQVDTKFQKKCPMCGGQFNLLEFQNLWQCFTCGYEEPAAGAPQRPGEPADGPVFSPPPRPAPEAEQPVSFAEPVASMVEKQQGSPKGSFIDEHPATKKKTCPSCRRKMFWYPDQKTWRCPDCGYERRI